MISVIVPVYNMEQYLEQCLESIVKQTYSDLEILLINDGSNDKSGIICEQWAKQDRRIRVYHKENGGLSDARNMGLEYAKGEYLCFVDSDDYMEADMLEKLLDALENNAAEIAVCNFVYEYLNGQECRHHESRISKNMVMTGREFMILTQKEKGSFGVVVWNKLFQKEIFQNIRFPKGKFHEDEFVFHQIMYSRKKICCIPTVGYHYVQRRYSITSEGPRFPDCMEAMIERCNYMVEQNDKELAVLSEGGLIIFEKLLRHRPKSENNDRLKKQHFKIVIELYRRGWIKTDTLLKRYIRYKIL